MYPALWADDDPHDGPPKQSLSTVYGYLNEKTKSISQSSRSITRRTYSVTLLVEGQNGSFTLSGKSAMTNSVVKGIGRRHCDMRCWEWKEEEMMSIGKELMGTPGRFHHPLYGMFSQGAWASRMSKTFPGLCSLYGNSLTPLFLLWKISQAFVLF